jgi:hypothetical protein
MWEPRRLTNLWASTAWNKTKEHEKKNKERIRRRERS